MKINKLITSLLLSTFLSTSLADSGDVKFINTSAIQFTLNSNELQAAQAIGLPSVISSNLDKNIHLTLSNEDAGKIFHYESLDKKYHFSVSVESAQNFINHHTTFKTIDYLSVDWGNLLSSSSVKYVLPLFWQDDSYKQDQPVRVDSDNNALIGIFANKPKNVLTVMSYNTDKDSTGTDHNPKYNSITDITNLFTSKKLPTPDVLMIQEGLGQQDLAAFKKSLSKLTNGDWYAYYKTEGNRPDSNIIFVNPTINPNEISSGNIVFKDQCGWGLVGKRNAVYVDLPLSEFSSSTSNQKIRIFDTHLESGSGSDIFFHAAKVRFSQFSEILNYPRTGVLSLIIAGDFNTMPIFDSTTGLTNYQFGDLLSVFDNYLGNPKVNWGQPITCTWSTCTKYTLNVGMWTDRMYNTLLSLPGYKTYVLYPTVGHHVDGVSDHLPIWTTFYFEKE